ncbi:NAD(+) diphosphatase [Nigerium massiliense]|uniref:NAD(+) diphosphatase n=1 Tax=Nigerium massiliense TaxID=1522317 RepID=UPI0006936DF5|nr:NAD(+) diphosphatase [Nigerium massiliense]
MDLWVPDSQLDRADPQRTDPDWVRRIWSDDAVVLGIDARGDVAVTPDGTALDWRPASGEFVVERQFLLGLVDGVPHFAAALDELPRATSLREIGPTLDDTSLDLVTTAIALVNWHAVAPFCGVCGGPTQVRAGGTVRYCPRCERERFPRMDPAVIVAVLDDDGRLFLGHHVGWPQNRVSILAGFVSAGESLEQAVRREVAEESGLTLGEVRYVGSQPWPFPRSLMLGFVARATSVDAQVDGEEIEWGDFYSIDEVEQRVADGRLALPMPLSIASTMISSWRRGELDVAAPRRPDAL